MSRFDEIVQQVNKKFKQEIITQGVKDLEIKRIPFSSPYLNYMTHGGFPRARTVEFFGEENGGKTTTAIDIVANAQKVFKQEWEQQLEALKNATNKTDKARYEQLLQQGALKIVYFDLEVSFDTAWATKLGVNVNENFWLVRPAEGQSAEEILNIVVDMLASNEVGLIVVDSIPSLEPENQMNEGLEKQTYGGISKLLSAFFRKATPYLRMTNASLLLINQIRDSMNPYKLYETPGGRALKHACSLRLMFKKGQLLDEELKPTKRSSELAYGNEVSVKLEKTKCFPPDRLLASYTLAYYEGIDWVSDLADMLINLGIIVQNGSWFTFSDPNTGEILEKYKTQGKPNVKLTLKNNPELLELYKTYVNLNVIP